MQQIFNSEDCEAVILVDASNAFNAMNRRVALHNMQFILPAFAIVLINTYRTPSRLFITGGKEILSQEGTTQGDNLAMAFYALSTLLMQNRLRQIECVKQVWLADDATGAGEISFLKTWWDTLVTEGGKCGYYVNASKSWVISKNSDIEKYAKETFSQSGVKFTTTGKRHLGACIGSEGFRNEYVTRKVEEWCKELKKLSSFAIEEPHAAFSAFTHGEIHRFSYFLRTIPGMEEYLKPLDAIIDDMLLPALLGHSVSENERQLFKRSIADGGLGIPILMEKSTTELESSKKITAPLVETIIKQGTELPSKEIVKNARFERSREVNDAKKEIDDRFYSQLDPEMKRNIDQIREKGASSWLSVLPIKDQGFNLTKQEFHDALALRYNTRIKNLPSKCPCGAPFDSNHAMTCKKGGFITIRHNNIRDFEANLLKKVCNDVEIEPTLQPVNNDEARLDIRARGFWRPGQSAFFDVRVTNTNANSQKDMPLSAIYKKHEDDKKRKYGERVLNNEHGSFTPLVFSMTGGMSSECIIYHKFLAEKIAQKSEQRYDQIMAWIRCKLSFIIIRSALLCLRGSRSVKMNTEVTEDYDLACIDARI